MLRFACAALILLSGLAVGCATTTNRNSLPTLETVGQVDLPRYLGTWYEIASFPQSFQRGCHGSVALYSARPDGEIDVLNRCRLDSLSGPLKEATGRARVVDSKTNSKLEVSFFRPFWGAYWVVELGHDYEYAVVGHPSRDYLWVLSRTPQLAPGLYEQLLARLGRQGYDVSRLELTEQPKAD